jgi:hypothetical protein
MNYGIWPEGEELLSKSWEIQYVRLAPAIRPCWVLRRRDIEVDHRVAMTLKGVDRVGSNETGPARDQDPERSALKLSQLG